MKKEKSCGIIVFDEEDRVLVVKHNKGHYGFPKGHVEENETEEETALRETKEETNCDVEIIKGFRETITYSPKEEVTKDVVFFVGRPLSHDIKPQEKEISDTLFVPIKEVYVLLTGFKDMIEILKKAEVFIKKENEK